MITEDEKRFIAWWEKNRLNKRKALWQIAAGLPLGVFLAVAIFINYFSTWYRRAAMEVNVRSSGVLVVLIGLVSIVVFIVVFSARHRWEMNEQRYKELTNKK
ncbi:MAG: hypothetical protein WBC06_18590 [Chitinophagaceae bacterium]